MYLIDPSVDEWDRDFTSKGGLMNLVGKKGVVLGVGIDLAGNFCGQANQVAIKTPAGDTIHQCTIPCAAVTAEDEWRPVSIKFDIDDLTCDMSIGGVQLFEGIRLQQVSIPHTLCIGVCASTIAARPAFIAVNNISLVDHNEEDEEDVNNVVDAEVAVSVKNTDNELVAEADELLTICRQIFSESTIQDNISTPKSASKSGVDANEFGLAALCAGH